MQRILVLGAGFAGLWAAIGAARKLDEIGVPAGEIEVLVVDRRPFHAIRVRNYEADLSDVAIPLGDVLDPIGVAHLCADVVSIEPLAGRVTVATPRDRDRLFYDRLVLALGSEVRRPSIPGLVQHGFDVDTYPAARRLEKHLSGLCNEAESEARGTVVVAGAGFTGIEVAAEMPERLRRALAPSGGRVVLLDRHRVVGATIGEAARPVICEALRDLGVETRLGVTIAAVEPERVTLASGEVIATRTLVWCAGMQANPLTAMLPGSRDHLGRLRVDSFMRTSDMAHVFAAGDAAVSVIDGVHQTVMSCQFARPMGRFAGHNVVADLLGRPLLPLEIDWYVTVLDLGAWGALYTDGWDRRVHLAGAAAKATKRTINQQRIYPPRTGERAELLAAAAPIVQSAPEGISTTPTPS